MSGKVTMKNTRQNMSCVRFKESGCVNSAKVRDLLKVKWKVRCGSHHVCRKLNNTICKLSV